VRLRLKGKRPFLTTKNAKKAVIPAQAGIQNKNELLSLLGDSCSYQKRSFLSPAPFMDSKQDGGVRRFLLCRARLPKTIWLLFVCFALFVVPIAVFLQAVIGTLGLSSKKPWRGLTPCFTG
jgi:hypothetical protein